VSYITGHFGNTFLHLFVSPKNTATCCGHGLAGLLNDMIGLRHQEPGVNKGSNWLVLILSDRRKGGWPIIV